VNINKFLDRAYDEDKYNCVHFTRDVWLELTGVDIEQHVKSLLGDPAITTRHGFRRVREPRELSLVWLRGAAESHAGVFVDGKILHLSKCGAIYQRVEDALMGFLEVRYYVATHHN
jgi:hypothetical protein